MDTVALVRNQIEDGQALLVRLAKEGCIVLAACWAKPWDEDRWSLYLVTPAAVEKGDASGTILSVLRALGKSWVTSSNLYVIDETHAIARGVFDLQQRYADLTWVRQPMLGSLPFEEIYLYSIADVELTIYGLLYRGEPGGVLHLSFEPHNGNSWLEVESEGKRIRYPAETGLDCVVAAPRGAVLERTRDRSLELAWDFRGRRTRSSANDIWSLAKLDLHGFRLVHEMGSLVGGR